MAKDIDDNDDDGEPNAPQAEKLPPSVVIERALASIRAAKLDASERNGMLKADLDAAKADGANVRALKIVAQIEAIKKAQDRDAVASHLMFYLERRGFGVQPDLFGHNSGAQAPDALESEAA